MKNSSRLSKVDGKPEIGEYKAQVVMNTASIDRVRKSLTFTKKRLVWLEQKLQTFIQLRRKATNAKEKRTWAAAAENVSVKIARVKKQIHHGRRALARASVDESEVTTRS